MSNLKKKMGGQFFVYNINKFLTRISFIREVNTLKTGLVKIKNVIDEDPFYNIKILIYLGWSGNFPQIKHNNIYTGSSLNAIFGAWKNSH